jgi:hypothetical protein
MSPIYSGYSGYSRYSGYSGASGRSEREAQQKREKAEQKRARELKADCEHVFALMLDQVRSAWRDREWDDDWIWERVEELQNAQDDALREYEREKSEAWYVPSWRRGTRW